ncbi:MAG: hypothetical protein COA42_19960, partial [Alteromonadaceae bacterium]
MSRDDKNLHISLQLVRGLALAMLLFALLFSASSFAHVKWFVDASLTHEVGWVPYTLQDTAVLAWLVVATSIIAASILLDSKIPTPPTASNQLSYRIIEVLRLFTGISLLLTAYDGNLVAPHLPGSEWLGSALIWLQSIIGVLFIANRAIPYASALVFILFLGLFIQHGIISIFEYCNMLGIALFFLFNNFPSKIIQQKLKPYSVDVLRIFTGLSLIALGITEKLSDSALGETFITQYHWNFMSIWGFDLFSNQLFVFSAGVMEVVFGVILILGTTTRLNTLVLAIFLTASNIAIWHGGNNQLAMMELIGHMPIIGSALIFLLIGYGQRLKVTNVIDHIFPTHTS